MVLTATEAESALTFVCSELARYSQMSFDQIKNQHFSDILATIKGQDGHNRMIGSAAQRKLQEVAEAALRDSPYDRRVDPKAAGEKVREGFSRQFLVSDPKPTSAEEDRELLAGWIEEAGAACKTLTHFIPCQIGLKKAEQVRIGPVTIKTSVSVRASLEPNLNAYTRDGDVAGLKHRTELVDLSRGYLSSFSDVAEVTVPDCDPATSRRIASEAVQAALNFIHLAAGGPATKSMRGGGPKMRGLEEATVALDEDGTAHLGWSKSWEGASIHSNFWTTLEAPDQSSMVSAVAVAIDTIVQRRDPQMAAARYLDAVSWFADATRERSRPASIVKYLTAMERLLWTGEKGAGVTTRLAERAAALCFSPSVQNFDALCQDIRDAYNLRSGILHGRLSAVDPVVLRSHRLCERVARDLLLAWLERYGHGFDTPTTIAKAKAHFDGLVTEVKERSKSIAGGVADAEGGGQI